ncbi:hypothetical protein [Neobacillus sp. 114]|uniref:hypothetical protein n=1 Tax=Neobacillus sp. 114 TaxID=3048535 RepID=UPI0024C431B4|nr:hypothetical protein [Neobacillus sp. 114]
MWSLVERLNQLGFKKEPEGLFCWLVDGAIVGSSLKVSSDPSSAVSLEKVKSLVESI